MVKSAANLNRKETAIKKDHMRKIQNDNITFRVTTDLKSRLTEFCLENDLHNSAVLRQALVKYLKEQQMEMELPCLIVRQPADVDAHHHR
jgi:hypothetical protein